jgi:hypothetical protein
MPPRHGVSSKLLGGNEAGRLGVELLKDSLELRLTTCALLNMPSIGPLADRFSQRSCDGRNAFRCKTGCREGGDGIPVSE